MEEQDDDEDMDGDDMEDDELDEDFDELPSEEDLGMIFAGIGGPPDRRRHGRNA
jgi:hypothetical protein